MPPNVPNGIITYYSIERNGTNIGNFSSNELMYTIEGLSPDTVYVLQLRAHTGAGPGLPSNVTFITCKLNAKQKHLRCKKGEANQKQQLSDYKSIHSYTCD